MREIIKILLGFIIVVILSFIIYGIGIFVVQGVITLSDSLTYKEILYLAFVPLIILISWKFGSIALGENNEDN